MCTPPDGTSRRAHDDVPPSALHGILVDSRRDVRVRRVAQTNACRADRVRDQNRQWCLPQDSCKHRNSSEPRILCFLPVSPFRALSVVYRACQVANVPLAVHHSSASPLARSGRTSTSRTPRSCPRHRPSTTPRACSRSLCPMVCSLPSGTLYSSVLCALYIYNKFICVYRVRNRSGQVPRARRGGRARVQAARREDIRIHKTQWRRGRGATV